jgi:hypothetical protein
MLSKMMLEGGNVRVLDDPTNHLDLEALRPSITPCATALAAVAASRPAVHRHRDQPRVELTPDIIVPITAKEYLADER